MYKIALLALLWAFPCVSHASLEGGGVMLMARRNTMAESRLPYAYELAAIRGYGNQWMNLGIKPSNETGFEVVYGLHGDTANERIIGSYSGSNGRFCFVTRGVGYTEIYFGWNSAYNFSMTTRGKKTASLNFLNDRVFVVDGVVLRDVGGEKLYPTQPWNILMFTTANANDGSANAEMFDGNIYSCKVSVGDKIVMDLIPVMSYDGNPEMYDKIGKKFIERHGDFGYVELES